MATNRILQLLRSNQVYGSKELAIAAVTPMSGADGEIRLARYNAAATGEPENIKSLLCVYHTSPSLPEGKSAGWTFIEDASANQGTAESVQAELDHLEAQVGQDGASNNFASGATSGSDAEQILTGAQDNTGSAPTNLTNAVTNVATYIGTLDKTASAVDGQVVTTVAQANGQVSETKANVKDLQLGGYTKDANASGAIGSTDTVNTALSKLENAIDAAEVHSNDQSITVAADATNGGTNIEVNVDGATIVKDATSHAIKTNLKIAQVVTGTPGTDEIAGTLGNNVKEAYVLTDGTNSYGKQINIYKDSALQSVKLLHADLDADPQLKPTYSNGTWTDIASASQTEENLALCYAYLDVNGDTIVEAVPVGDFLRESEFGDGLQVNSGTVSVKKDTTSGKVRIADAPTSGEDTGLVDVLTVSSNGVKVDNIQAAINYAVQNASSDLAVSAAGDSVYIAAAVDANDNKKINVTGTYGAFNTPTAADNTLSATTNGIAKAEDVATAVNTVVGNLDGSATATAASGDVYTVLTSVTETNGVITKGGEVTLAAVAKTGAAADVTVAADQTSGLAAGNVQDTLEALKTSIDGGLDSVSSGNGAIAVGTKTNKDQSISLVIAPHTAATDQTPATEANDMLSVTASGLSLSNVWDCGTY